MAYVFDETNKIGLNELDEYLKIRIGMIDGMSGDLSHIYPGATKVENVGGGKIRINDKEVVVYAHPNTHPVGMITGLHIVATSGKYLDLIGTPTSLPASDVYDWAKAPTKPTYSPEEVKAIPAIKLGAINGVAELDAFGKLVIDQLPDNLTDLATGKELDASQIPNLKVCDKLIDDPAKMWILGGLSSAELKSIDL